MPTELTMFRSNWCVEWLVNNRTEILIVKICSSGTCKYPRYEKESPNAQVIFDISFKELFNPFDTIKKKDSRVTSLVGVARKDNETL